jgi:ABC-type nickel/cobalt efflux system permease component RcnA
VLILYLICGIAGMIALYITQATIVEGYALATATALLTLLAIWWLERTWDTKNNHDQPN